MGLGSLSEGEELLVLSGYVRGEGVGLLEIWGEGRGVEGGVALGESLEEVRVFEYGL